MPGAIIIVVVLLLIPVVLCMSGAIAAGVIGWALKDDADERYEGSELIALNK
jgi:hypothetical protein